MAILSYVLIKIECQLVDDWHACLDDVEDVLGVLQETFVPLDVFESLNDVGGVVYVQFQLFPDQVSSDSSQSCSDVTEKL